MAFRDKRENPGQDTVNQVSGVDRGSISNLSHSRRAPSDAYLFGKCKFQFGSIGAHRLSSVQYLPEEQVNSADIQGIYEKLTPVSSAWGPRSSQT